MRKVTAALISFLVLSIFISNFAFAEDSTSSTTTRKDKIEQRIDTRKAIIGQRIDTKQENIANRLEEFRQKMASREAQLKTKLQAFKDKRKATVADRVNTNLNRINQNQTQQMLKHLEQMTTILNKLGDKGNKDAIASASASIALAKSAVETQALNDYTITVTSEATVKANAKTSRDKLYSDIMGVRRLVQEAKKALITAIRTAFPNGTKEGTSSGNE